MSVINNLHLFWTASFGKSRAAPCSHYRKCAVHDTALQYGARLKSDIRFIQLWLWCRHNEYANIQVGHTSCVRLHEKQSDQIIPLHAIPKPHRGRARLSQHNPWISIWNRCSFFLLLFFHCITRANPTKTLLLAAWFRASSNVKLIPHLRLFPQFWYSEEVMWNHWCFDSDPLGFCLF